MCESNAYFLEDGQEKIILESVDVVEPEGDDKIKLISIFGEQKIVQAKIKRMALVDHKILLEAV